MFAFFRLIFSDPMWWLPLLAAPAVCCVIVFLKFPRRVWIAPAAMLVFGVISMYIHVPLIGYRERGGDFYEFRLFLWAVFIFMQLASALLYTGVTIALIKVRDYRKRRKAE